MNDRKRGDEAIAKQMKIAIVMDSGQSESVEVFTKTDFESVLKKASRKIAPEGK